MTTTTSFGTLTAYASGEAIRPATSSEWLRSALAVSGGQPQGTFETSARELPGGFGTVFVDGGPDATASRDDIIALHDEAARAGDAEQVAICERALWGNSGDPHEAWVECERVILGHRAES